MDIQIFQLRKRQDPLAQTITAKEVKTLFKCFCRCKKVRIGRMLGKNNLDDLSDFWGTYVFYAKERKSLFSIRPRRIMFCPLDLNLLYIVPAKAVRFKKPERCASEAVTLKEEQLEKTVHKEHRYDRDHECILESIECCRDFSVSKTKITCTDDVLVYHFRWTNTDMWVRSKFRKTEKLEPMFFETREPEIKLYWGVQISYPDRPPLWGHYIDE